MARFSNVLVTGASSGLGRGLALHYAREGAVVHALARREEALRALAAEAAAAGAPGRVVPVVVDVADTAALVAAVGAAEREAGGALDLVIANAGTSRVTSGRRMRWEDVQRILQVNATGACVTVSAALPAMVARGAGTVVAVGSLAGLRGLPLHAAYCASKAALHTFMESLRVDLHGTGVRALTIQPGFVKTEIVEGNDFWMPFLMEIDDAVRVMAKGIARGDALIAYPWPMPAVARFLRAVPRFVYEPLASKPRAGRERPPRDGRP